MTIGNDFPVEPVASLRIGKDTKADVQRMFAPNLWPIMSSDTLTGICF